MSLRASPSRLERKIKVGCSSLKQSLSRGRDAALACSSWMDNIIIFVVLNDLEYLFRFGGSEEYPEKLKGIL